MYLPRQIEYPFRWEAAQAERAAVIPALAGVTALLGTLQELLPKAIQDRQDRFLPGQQKQSETQLELYPKQTAL
jgi:hypothetical protein